ncbi:MAG: fibronectin type III domain-containing protein, partial [Armatimonadetes bacterium]|nr:fibronectin type III domain-containing protein [Armatimonadota bacterium]
AWEPYATTRSWTFVPGYNTVYAQFKDAVGTISSVVSDSDTTAPSGSITINSSAPCTNSISVTLTPSATDTESGVYQMRFANAGSGWSAWEAYSTNKSWTMPSGDGTKIVYAQFKDFAGNYTTFSDSIILDTVAPTTPGIPTDAGAFTNSTSLVFNWTAASDTGSGIASYNCQVGTTPGGNDVFDGNIGNTFSKTVVGSHYGKRYYCRVQARDNAGNASAWSASSDGISVVEHVGITIGAAKGLLESVSVGLAGKAVTRIFGGYFYVEEMNRSAGIRVNPAGGLPDGLAVGKLVDVGGPVRTSMDYERWIDATVSVGSGTASIAPVGIGSLYLGGGDWQYSLSSVKGQRGITGAWGLNNIGLLVRTWGRVKSRDTGTSSFMISDGSGVDVKVIDLGVTPPLVDAFVVVTGIASCYSVGGEVHRLIQVTEPGGLAGLQ